MRRWEEHSGMTALTCNFTLAANRSVSKNMIYRSEKSWEFVKEIFQ